MRKLRLFLQSGLFVFLLSALAVLAAAAVLAVLLPRALAPVAAAERLFSLAAALTVTRGRPAEYKLAEASLIFFFPWVGAIFCLLFFGRIAPKDFTGTMSGPPPSAFAPAALSDSLLGLAPCSLSDAVYFKTGREMYRSMCADLKEAERFIWLEYYIVGEGKFWGDLCAILSEKANRGVDVRLICDGFGSALTLPRHFRREMRARGIRVCIFRPLRFPSRAAGRRDHRKLLVIDGRIAYTGGVNLADEYIGEKIRFGHWKDTGVRVTGSCATRMAELFTRTYRALCPASSLTVKEDQPEGGAPCAVIADSTAEHPVRAGHLLFLRLIAGARERLYLFTPYLAPDTVLMHALVCAAHAGTDVRIMIPHIPDKKLPFLITRSYAHELARAGVRVREYTDGFLHAKSVLSDGTAFIASYNLDFRSLYLQAECGIAAEYPPLAAALAEDFLSAWESGTPLPAQSRLRRAAARLLRILAPLI